MLTSSYCMNGITCASFPICGWRYCALVVFPVWTPNRRHSRHSPTSWRDSKRFELSQQPASALRSVRPMLSVRLGDKRALRPLKLSNCKPRGFDCFPHRACWQRFVFLRHDVSDVIVDVGPDFDNAWNRVELAGNLFGA